MPEAVEEDLEIPEFTEEEIDDYFEKSQEQFEDLLNRVSRGTTS